jgi:drug/metabolite transporter (DMT)-like permease
VSDSLLGIALAAAASSCFNLAIVVQAGEARAVGREHSMRLSLLGELAKRRRWLAGLALAAFAVPLQTLALTLAPLSVVQPADATGLVVLLVAGSVMLGERVGRREILSVAAIAAGVVLVTLAGSEHSDSSASAATLALVLGPLAVLALAPFALRSRGVPSWSMVVGAGLAFAIGAFALKLIADALSTSDWLALVAAGVVAGAMALVGMNGEMSALQVRPVAAVAPVIFAIELAVPVVLGPLVGGESWPTAAPQLIALLGGLTVTVAGAVSLMRSRSVVAVLEAEHAVGA